MAGIPPIKRSRVPFRKTREALEDIYSQLDRLRPITDGDLSLEANGWRINSRLDKGGDYTPPFHPTFNPSTLALTIAPGYFHGPYRDAGAANPNGEIPTYHYYPWMPLMGLAGDELTADPAPTLGLDDDAENLIYLKVPLDTRVNRIGGTTTDGELGVHVELADDGDPTHDHGASALVSNYAFHLTGAPYFEKVADDAEVKIGSKFKSDFSAALADT